MSGAVTPPEDFFGFQMWSDRKIARFDRIVDGRVVLIDFRMKHRAQTHGTFKHLLNSLI